MVKKVTSVLLMITLVLFTNIHITYAITASNDTQYDGIDVSNWQGYVNYNLIKRSGIEVVYIKASEGKTFKDPYFEYNYQNAKAQGLKVGFYHFLTATNEEDAKVQAQFFASVISGKVPDCKLVMDFEQFNGGITAEQINSISQVFLQTLQEFTKKEVMIYSNLYDTQRVFNSQLAKKYPLWLAYYGDYQNLQNVHSNWETWEGVQYTSRGIVPGINGYVDKNKFTSNIFLKKCTNCPEVESPNSEPNTETIYYTVKRGDTLTSIASYYGTTVEEIAEINNITNPNLIYQGQILKILTNSNIQGSQTNEMGHTVYTVRRGDNLWNISKRYGVTIQSIVDVNQIRNPNLIYPGQKLRIPTSLPDTENVNQVTYVVKRGDSLWRIAKIYRVTVRYLVNLNGIKNPNLIYIGQVIRIK